MQRLAPISSSKLLTALAQREGGAGRWLCCQTLLRARLLQRWALDSVPE